jgi:hypothetical protein
MGRGGRQVYTGQQGSGKINLAQPDVNTVLQATSRLAGAKINAIG